MKAISHEERLERHSMPEPNSGCLLWTAAVDRHGYGVAGHSREGKHVNKFAKVTDEIVRAIRRSPERGSDLAARFGITPGAVSMIRNGKAWTHVVEKSGGE